MDVIKSLAQIDVYLNAGKKNIEDDNINAALLSISLNFNISVL